MKDANEDHVPTLLALVAKWREDAESYRHEGMRTEGNAYRAKSFGTSDTLERCASDLERIVGRRLADNPRVMGI